ncbi:hypothetical protein HUW62_09175 [Myxococcus sp. AM011]|uniref:hypothetical protein n=1 Tax=Myxococcus sp. AM011 TaxID=2745200 RepID=UPI001595ADDA|nr:hypothetical protein [Myxococcus sp. AM011]NVJ21388.1 hypothetical protein [Myxococcus sp. AM011]
MSRFAGALFVVAVVVAVFPLRGQAEECPEMPDPTMSTTLALFKTIQEDRAKVCAVIGEKPLPERFLKEASACFDKHLMPCARSTAKGFMPLLEKCIQGKNLFSDTGMCTRWDEAMTCMDTEIRDRSSSATMAMMKHLGLVQSKTKKFEACFRTAAQKVKKK